MLLDRIASYPLAHNFDDLDSSAKDETAGHKPALVQALRRRFGWRVARGHGRRLDVRHWRWRRLPMWIFGLPGGQMCAGHAKKACE
ncbi:MAG TPA: hypothetical protein VMJ11_05330 [Paraburkholderia sp.]|uniref:hypothetical protein n=1 Tax=Paraburkholderia sp. TaxID=1926495 RepID=UPI002C737684|nr:hypothetical protein [Paraburkholderia sp.]HTR06075.1 hypothetical protein [Paraburkholderia sp.]